MEITKSVEKGKIVIGNADKEEFKSAVHVGYGIDENFVMPMGVSCISILKNNPQLFFVFHVLIEEISSQSQEKLKNIVEHYPHCLFVIHLLDLSILEGIQITKWGKATYLRAFLGQVAGDNVERIFYLDGDILCVGSIAELIKKDFNNQTVMVVEDDPSVAKKQKVLFKLKHYFNAGMLYINLAKWRENKIAEKFLDTCFSYGTKLHYADQDALNLVLQDQKIMVDRAYDFIFTDRSLEDVPEGTVFIHYTGGKPWQCWEKYPLAKYWLKYYALSPWKNEPLVEPRTYQQMHSASRHYWRRGEYKLFLYWHIRYLQTKIIQKW